MDFWGGQAGVGDGAGGGGVAEKLRVTSGYKVGHPGELSISHKLIISVGDV